MERVMDVAPLSTIQNEYQENKLENKNSTPMSIPIEIYFKKKR
jgi:hypothetical protein